jgi:chromosome segregation ATPase
VGNLLVSVDDLNRRLEIYSAQLLDQARWQAELFVMDVTREHQLEKAVPLAEQAIRIAGQAVDSFARMVPALERSVSTLEKAIPRAESALTAADRAVEALARTLPAMERALAVIEKTPALVAAERTAALQGLSAELTHTLAFIQDERLATLKQFTTERIAAVRDLAEAVVEQRKGLTQDIDGIAAKAVDRAFLRAAQLGAAVLVAGFFAIIVLMVIARRVFFGSRGSGDQPRSRVVAGPV